MCDRTVLVDGDAKKVSRKKNIIGMSDTHTLSIYFYYINFREQCCSGKKTHTQNVMWIFLLKLNRIVKCKLTTDVHYFNKLLEKSNLIGVAFSWHICTLFVKRHQISHKKRLSNSKNERKL